MEILLKQEESKGGAYIGNWDKPDAAMTYSLAGDDVMIVDHTEVSDSFRGQSVGRKLLDVLVEKARQEGKKIIPLCPYVKSVFDKDESIGDVLK